ncbi:MAG: hypothetical protein R2711_09975 [Acidimicrobiales bacterium]
MPFVCGATNLGEALRRISEEIACMIRSRARRAPATWMVRRRGGYRSGRRAHHPGQSRRAVRLGQAPPGPAPARAGAARRQRPCRPLFCARQPATPADAALAMQLGAGGTSAPGIFKSDNPLGAKAIVEATHFNSPRSSPR